MKQIRKKLLAILLLIVMIVSALPVQSTDAAPASIGVVGNTHITYDDYGNPLYTIYVENGSLYIKGEYATDSKALLSYHTEYLYFTTEPTGGYPKTASRCYPVKVHSHKSEPSERPGYVYDTYVINAKTLEDAADFLFGDRNALKGGRQVYISEGYVLKRRSSASDVWKYSSEELDTIDKIRNAAEWSAATKRNFRNYYDIELNLDLLQYTLSATATEGGFVSGDMGKHYYGDEVTLHAKSDKEDYEFVKWNIKEGSSLSLDDVASETITFIMPQENVSLEAVFEYKGGPMAPVTPTPIPTPDPDKPAVTPKPTPTPEPTPTPPYMPAENTETIQKSVRYYSTDAGYSIGGIYNKTVTPRDEAFGYVATQGQDNMGYRFDEGFYENKGGYSYKVGTDSAGNTWYFISDGSKATYVHPKEYKGYEVDSAEVRYITELTFPEVITYNGGNYTVTSIGGGTDKYTINGEDVSNRPIAYGTWGPTYNSYDEYVNETYQGAGLRTYTKKETKGRMLGVIGNGQIWSSYFLHEFYSNGTKEHIEFENSYYVNNTTLQYITIPDTVTRIESYSFLGCQALVKIIGGENVTTVGEYAFSATGEQTVSKSKVEQNSNGSVQKFEYYYYNGSYTFDAPTATMSSWQKNVMLSAYMEFPELTSLKTLGVSAFEGRKNLFVVALPAGVEEIGANAFANCLLDKIIIPGKTTAISDVLLPSGKEEEPINSTPEQTLGTKGKNVAEKTLIVTELNSKAMDYGMTYEEYYDVRAGYQVTYHNNGTPTETYVSKPKVEFHYVTFKERLPLSGSRLFDNDALPNEPYYGKEVLLDTDGSLYFASVYDLPVRQLPNLTFDNVYTFKLVNTSGTTVYFCLAFAENGTVYLYQKDTDAWTSLGVPAGSSNFVFHKNVCGSGGQGVTDITETLNLYYINQSGKLYKKSIYSQVQSTISGPDGDTLTSVYTLYTNAPTAVALPSGVSAVKRFCFNSELTYTLGYPPEINMEDSQGRTWMSAYDSWFSTGRYTDKPIGEMERQEEQEIYASTGITDFGPRLVGYTQTETVYANMFDNPGKEFLGWNTAKNGSGTSYQPGQLMDVSAPITLYAQWKNKNHVIRYAPNGGTGEMADDVYDYAVTTVSLKENAFTKQGHAFVGWNTEPDGSGISYIDMQTVTLPLPANVLYAQWQEGAYTLQVAKDAIGVTPVIITKTETLKFSQSTTAPAALSDKTFTVNYHVGDGSFVTPVTGENTTATLEFYGWELHRKITDGYEYALQTFTAGETISHLSECAGDVMTLFPYWSGDASYVKLPVAERPGYVFIGWKINDSDEIITVTESGASYYKPIEDTEMYAYYEKKKQEGYVSEFEIYNVFGTPAWEEIKESGYCYTIGTQENTSNLWKTLPLRNGVHPIYRNLGGLSMGGGFSFRVLSEGLFAEENVTLTIIPHFCPVGDEGYYDGNLYFEQKTDKGRFLKQWQPEEQAIVLYAGSNSVVTEDGSSRIWSGMCRVPEQLWIAETTTDVIGYQRQFGLSFEEPFWKKNVRLMLRFTLCFTNGEGECLYYGMLPEESEKNIWVQEAGETYREDYDKNRYEILGGEIAVIYPGDSADRWNCIHGIY